MRSEGNYIALPMTFCKAFEIKTDYFPRRCTTKKRVSSRGWRSAPRDLTPAQAPARYERDIQRIRPYGHLCDPIAARGASARYVSLWMTRIHRFGYRTSPQRQLLTPLTQNNAL